MAEKGNERSLLVPLLGFAGAVLIVFAVVWFFFLRSGGAEVHGEVTLDGKAVSGAVITFMPDGGKNAAPIVAVSDKDGSYRLVGNVDAGVPAGAYKVAVVKEAIAANDAVPQGEELEKARAAGLLVNRLPKIYEDYNTTPLKVDVRSGRNTINLELKKQ